jgi:natural product precursor
MKKLALQRETIRALAKRELTHAVGGAKNPTRSCDDCGGGGGGGGSGGSNSWAFDCQTRNFC